MAKAIRESQINEFKTIIEKIFSEKDISDEICLKYFNIFNSNKIQYQNSKNDKKISISDQEIEFAKNSLSYFLHHKKSDISFDIACEKLPTIAI